MVMLDKDKTPQMLHAHQATTGINGSSWSAVAAICYYYCNCTDCKCYSLVLMSSQMCLRLFECACISLCERVCVAMKAPAATVAAASLVTSLTLDSDVASTLNSWRQANGRRQLLDKK